MKKEKEPKDSKQNKRLAFMSFLEAPTTPESEIIQEVKKVNSDHEDCYEQFVQDSNSCNVCGKDVDPLKKKKCGFCNLETCSDHLRKRRKKKNKWERICDNCEDKFIYDIYMKLEAKRQESMLVEEEITTLKWENYLKDVEEKRETRKEMAFKTMTLQQRHQDQMKAILNHQNKFFSVENKLQSDQITIKQLQIFVQRVQHSFKENCEEDFKIMTQQNARLAKELAKIQKKCAEVRMVIQKRQKEIESAYESWEKKQYNKRVQNDQNSPSRTAAKKESCIIY